MMQKKITTCQMTELAKLERRVALLEKSCKYTDLEQDFSKYIAQNPDFIRQMMRDCMNSRRRFGDAHKNPL